MPVNDLHNTQELLVQIAAGDEASFNALFTTYRDRLFFFIKGFLHSEEVAEELVLDVFLKIWLGRELLPEVDNIQAFLFRIARNKSIDFFRANAHNAALKESLLTLLTQDGGNSADEVLMVKEYEALLRKAIAQLPPQRKQAWQLSREQHLSHDEIAQQMNISRHTVNSHISEARRFIREHLSQHLDIAIVLVLFHY